MNELVKKPEKGGGDGNNEVMNQAHSKSSQHDLNEESPEMTSTQMHLPQMIHTNMSSGHDQNGPAISHALMTRKMLPSKV